MVDLGGAVSDLLSMQPRDTAAALKAALKDNYVMSTTNHSNSLDKTMTTVHQSLIRSGHCPLTFINLFHRSWSLSLLLLVASPSAALGICSAYAYQRNWVENVQYIRLIVTLKNGSAQSLELGDAGLLLDGCKVGHGSSVWRPGADFFALDYESPRQFNGWYFVAMKVTAGSFFLNGSMDNETWATIGTPSWIHTAWGTRIFRREFWDIAEDGHRTRFFDMRASWPWLLGDVVAPLLVAAGIPIVSFLGLSGYQAFVSAAFLATCLAILSLLYMSAFIGGLFLVESTMQYWFGALWSLLFPLSIVLAPSRFVFTCSLFGAFLTSASLYRTMRAYGLGWTYIFFSDLTYQGAALIFLSVTVQANRRWRVRSANKLVEADSMAYEDAWKNLQHHHGSDLDSLACQILRECPQPPAGPGLLQQTVVHCPNLIRRSRASYASSAAAGSDFGDRTIVKSLGQLYAQASVVHIWLREKARAWALLSRGMVHVRSNAQDGAPCHGRQGDSSVRFVGELEDSTIGWADIKSVDRAAEKVLLCYGQDVSRLLDVTRQRIVFSSVADLASCLRHICSDSEVVLARVKNLLDPACNASQTAGYRHVVVNLSFRSDDSVRLGLDGHLCELQLALVDFIQQQNPRSHERYKRFRPYRPHLLTSPRKLQSGDAILHSIDDSPDRESAPQQPAGRCRGTSSVASCDTGIRPISHDDEGNKSLATSDFVQESTHVQLWSKVPSVYRVDLLPEKLLTAASETIGLQRRYQDGMGMRVSSAAGSLASVSEMAWSRVSSAVEPLSRTPSWSRTSSSHQSPGHRRLSFGVLPSNPIRSVLTNELPTTPTDPPLSSVAAPICREVSSTEVPAQLQRIALPGTSTSPTLSPASPREAVFQPIVGHWHVPCDLRTLEKSSHGKNVGIAHDGDNCPAATNHLSEINAAGGCGCHIQINRNDDSGHAISENRFKLMMTEARLITEDQWLKQVIEPEFLRRNLLPSSFLGDVNRAIGAAMANTAAASVFHTSTPLAAVASKAHYQALIFGFAITYTAFATFSLILARGSTLGGVRKLRLVVTALRGGANPGVWGPGISSLGLLRDGCPVLFQNSWGTFFAGAPAMFTVELPENVDSANGWYLQTSDSSSTVDPVQFILETCNSPNETEWVAAGTPQWITNDFGLVRLLGGEIRGPAWERGSVVKFDMRPGAAWYAAWPGADLVFAVAMLLCVALALRGSYSAAVQAFLGAFVADACLYWAAAANYTIVGSRLAFVLWTYGAGCIFMAVAGVLRQQDFFAAILCHGIWLFLLTAINMSPLIFGDTAAVIYTPLATGLVEMVFGATVLVLRRHVLRRAAHLIEPDRHQYQELWKELMAQSGAAEDLRDLDLAVSTLLEKCDKSAGVLLRQATNDLDQLYAQAAGVDLLLRHKVLEWLWSSEALLELEATKLSCDDAGPVQLMPASTRGRNNAPPFVSRHTIVPAATGEKMPRFVGRAELDCDTNLLDRVRWGRLKRIDRAAEKVLRTYRGDAARLLDVARQTLVFDSIRNLAHCLATIAEDQDVLILNVKNRYARAHLASDTAGFRNVAVNLRFICPSAKSLGLDGHVCELQLLLRSFALRKSNGGHSRYVAFRNERGE